jgi:hypothetical protein
VAKGEGTGARRTRRELPSGPCPLPGCPAPEEVRLHADRGSSVGGVSDLDTEFLISRIRNMLWSSMSTSGTLPSREAQRAACRSAAWRRSRPPLEAASAESEGPSSPIARRERGCVSWGVVFVTTFQPWALPRHSWGADAGELPLHLVRLPVLAHVADGCAENPL